jgi:hypothetical protein
MKVPRTHHIKYGCLTGHTSTRYHVSPMSYTDHVKSHLVQFIDQCVREVQDVQTLEDSELRSLGTSSGLVNDLAQIRGQVVVTTDHQVLTRLHDIFTEIATKAFFHQMSVKLRRRNQPAARVAAIR